MPDTIIELAYDTLDAIPEAFRGLYDEEDGKFALKGVNELKTPRDLSNVQEALRKEREDHAAARNAIKVWGDMKPDEVRASLDRIPELEAAAAGKLDDEAINKLVENRLTQKTGPLNRQIETITAEKDEWKNQAEALKAQIVSRDRNDAVRSVALGMEVHKTALDDILMVAGHYLEKTEDGKFIVKADAQGVTPGLSVEGFMKEMRKLRPHWWPASEGGGAGGGNTVPGGGANPWSASSWNFTEQGRIVQAEGMAVAERLAKAAGTTVGGTRPKPKQ